MVNTCIILQQEKQLVSKKGINNENADVIQNKTINVTPGTGNPTDYEILKDYSNGEDGYGGYAIYNAIRSGEIQYGTVKDLAFPQIIELFLQGNLVPEEFKIGLEAKGATNINIQKDGQNVKVTFTYNDKDYTLNCAFDAAKSQLDDVITDNTIDGALTGQSTRFNSLKNDAAVNEKWNILSERVLWTTLSSGLICMTDPSYMDAPNDPPLTVNFEIYFSLCGFILDYFGIEKPSHMNRLSALELLSDEQWQYVLNNPNIFHISENSKNNPPAIGYDDYIHLMMESLLEPVTSVDEMYYFNIKHLQSKLPTGNKEHDDYLKLMTDSKIAKNPLYQVKSNLENDTIEFTEDTINVLYEYLNLDYRSDGPNSDKYQMYQKIVTLFGFNKDDDKENIAEKVKDFCYLNGSTDGKTLNIEDYYIAVSDALGLQTYDECQKVIEDYLSDRNARIANFPTYEPGTYDVFGNGYPPNDGSFTPHYVPVGYPKN